MKLGALEAGGTKMVCAVGNEHGQVWERISIPTVSPEETERYQAYFNVSSLRNTQKGVRLRIVSDTCPMEGAQPADPDLEDVYLYHFREQ